MTSPLRFQIGRIRKVLSLYVGLFLLAGCSQLAPVKTVDAVPPEKVVANQDNAQLRQARRDLQSAERLQCSHPKDAMALNQSAAFLSLEALKSLSGKRSEEAIALYDYAVARLVETTLASKLKPWEKEVALPGPGGTFFLKLKTQSKDIYDPATDRLVAADRMEIGGVFFPDRVLVDGIGAPMVSAGPGRKGRWDADHHYYGVTAILTFSGRHGTLQILNPNQSTWIEIAGKTRPIAADMSAPVALTMIEIKPEGFGIKGLFNTQDHIEDAKLIMMQPYRSDRIPLIMAHGLSSSPATWVPIFNALNSNPKIREKYQIWVFRYPSGLPFPVSAALLREELAAVYQKYPETPKTFLIGHSMGGLICDLLIRNSGTQFATDILGKPVDQFDFDPDELKLINDALVFKASPHVSRVIFIATPHRGAEMASGPIGRFVASLIKLPINMVTLGPKVLTTMTQTEGENAIHRFPNSIDNLRPSARVVVALNKIPITPSVSYYSIIGNNGNRELWQSTDGTVPYFSSHLDGARSERVVPADHSAVLRNQQALTEVQRILLLP